MIYRKENNNWINEAYLIMTRDKMCDLLGISIKPVIKAVKLLQKFWLNVRSKTRLK